MKKLKVVICASLFVFAVGCSEQDFVEDTEPIIETIDQQKGTQSNSEGGKEEDLEYQATSTD